MRVAEQRAELAQQAEREVVARQMEFARRNECEELALVGEEASSVQLRLDEAKVASRLLEKTEAEMRLENEELRLCCEQLAVEAVEANTGQRTQAEACGALQ